MCFKFTIMWARHSSSTELDDTSAPCGFDMFVTCSILWMDCQRIQDGFTHVRRLGGDVWKAEFSHYQSACMGLLQHKCLKIVEFLTWQIRVYVRLGYSQGIFQESSSGSCKFLKTWSQKLSECHFHHTWSDKAAIKLTRI